MRRRFALAVALLAATACAPRERARPAPEPAPPIVAYDIGELRFSDWELDDIAKMRAHQARSRGIDTIKATSKVDALVMLESTLDATPMALDRFNNFARNAMWSDKGAWSELRLRARREYTGDDAVARRVRSLLEEWDRQKLRVVVADLENRKWKWDYSEGRWESEFHDFVRKRPLHAATWAWLVLGERRKDIQGSYGKSDLEHAYRFYLDLTRFGTAEEARELFALAGLADDLH